MNAQRMRSQFGIEAGTQPPETMSVIDLNMKLFSQLSIHRLNDLSQRVELLLGGSRQLRLLVTARQGSQAYPLVGSRQICGIIPAT